MKSFKSVKLLLWQKLLFLGVLWIIMVSVPTLHYGNEIRSQIAAIKLEQQGLVPTQLMLDIIQRTQQHRILTARFLREDPAVKNSDIKKQRRAKAENLEEAIVALEDYSSKMKNTAIEKSLEGITADWHQISQRVTVRDISLEQNAQLHELLIEKQIIALKTMMDAYRLNRDQESNNYFLLSFSLSGLPRLIEVVAKMQLAGENLLAQGEANFSERVELKSLLLFGNATLAEMNFAINKALAGNIIGKADMQQRYMQIQKHYQQLISTTQEEILGKASFSYTVETFSDLFTQNINNDYDFLRFSLTQVNTVLKERIEQKNQLVTKFYTLIFLLVVLTVIFTVYFVRKVLRSLGDKTGCISSSNQTGQ